MIYINSLKENKNTNDTDIVFLSLPSEPKTVTTAEKLLANS